MRVYKDALMFLVMLMSVISVYAEQGHPLGEIREPYDFETRSVTIKYLLGVEQINGQQLNTYISNINGWTKSGTSISLVNPSDKVGIGISVPSYKLDIDNGEIRVMGDNPYIRIEDSDSTESYKYHYIIGRGKELLFQTHDDGTDWPNMASFSKDKQILYNNVEIGSATSVLKILSAVNVTNNKIHASKYCMGPYDDNCITAWPSGGGGVSSQWATSGSDISYTAGKVGIGVEPASATLQVNGSVKLGADGTDVYGEWRDRTAPEPGTDTCVGNNINSEYTCQPNDEFKCFDQRPSSPPYRSVSCTQEKGLVIDEKGYTKISKNAGNLLYRIIPGSYTKDFIRANDMANLLFNVGTKTKEEWCLFLNNDANFVIEMVDGTWHQFLRSKVPLTYGDLKPPMETQLQSYYPAYITLNVSQMGNLNRIDKVTIVTAIQNPRGDGSGTCPKNDDGADIIRITYELIGGIVGVLD